MFVNDNVRRAAGGRGGKRTARRYNETVQAMQVHELEARVAIAAARLLLEPAAALRQLAQGAPAREFGRCIGLRFVGRVTFHARMRCKTFANCPLEPGSSATATRFILETATALSELAQITPARNHRRPVFGRLRVLPILSIPLFVQELISR